MIALIDNYDSFSYNLYQLVGSLRPDIRVIRNDAVTVEELRRMEPDCLILSPGPGRPKDAGICEAAVLELGAELPILGVCLGHQAICEAYGGTVGYAKRLMHGKQSKAALKMGCPLFDGCGPVEPVGRYHSLAADAETLPECLAVTAWAEDREVMAVQHKEYPVFGVQFHPESILTPAGKIMLRNFISLASSR